MCVWSRWVLSFIIIFYFIFHPSVVKRSEFWGTVEETRRNECVPVLGALSVCLFLCLLTILHNERTIPWCLTTHTHTRIVQPDKSTHNLYTLVSVTRAFGRTFCPLYKVRWDIYLIMFTGMAWCCSSLFLYFHKLQTHWLTAYTSGLQICNISGTLVTKPKFPRNLCKMKCAFWLKTWITVF